MSQKGSPRIRSLSDWIVRQAAGIRWASFVLLLLSATSLLWLRVDVGLVSMLPSGQPAFDSYAEFITRFAERDAAVAILRAPDEAAASQFAEDFVAALAEEEAVAGVRGSIDVDAFVDFAVQGGFVRFTTEDFHPALRQRLDPRAGPEIVSGIRGVLARPGSGSAATRMAADPLGFTGILAESLEAHRPDRALSPGSRYLTSADGQRLLLLIQPSASGYSMEEVARLSAALARAEVRARKEWSGVEGEALSIGYTGAFAFAREDAAMMRSDLMRYTGTAFFGVLFIFLVAARSGRFLPILGYHLLLGSLVTLAVGLLVFQRLDVISLAFAAIFYGLAIDAAIHFHTRFREEVARGGTPQDAVAATLAHILWPTTIASMTTGIAFALLGFASLEGIAQLGLLTAIGIFWNAVATLVLLPALLLGARPDWQDPGRALWLGRLTDFVAHHRPVFMVALVFWVAAVAAGAVRARLDTDLFALRPGDSEAAAVQDEISEQFGFTNPHGSVMLAVGAGAGEAGEEILLQAVEATTRRLESFLESGAVLSITSPSVLLPSLATQRNRIAWWAGQPREPAAVALETSLVEAGFQLPAFREGLQSLRVIPEPVSPLEEPPPGMEPIYEHHVREDSRGTAILVSFTPESLDALRVVATDLETRLPLPAGVSLQVAARPLMEAELSRTLRSEVQAFLVLVLVLTLGLLAWRERQPRVLAALVALPVLSVLGTVGVAGWLGLVFTPVNIIILPLVAGIALDDGLFLMARYRDEESIVPAMERGGRALSITTATTMVGFGALALSRYPALGGLGAVAAIGLITAFSLMIWILPLALPGTRR